MAQKFIIAGVRKLNEFKVIQLALTLLESKDYGDGELTEQKRRNEPSPMECESHTLLIEGHSTQGITIKQMIGGSIHVELPLLASFMDVELCYAYLNAVLQVHRAARILDENERAATLTDEAARQAWKQRLHNMGEILERGERQVVTGVNRDFHIAPSRYKDKKGAADPWIAFYYFEWLQWDYLEVRDAMEERQHLSDDEELSTLRVVDNTERLFIGACRYVGMLRDNICKIMPYDEFRHLVEKEDAFRAMDAAQGIFNKMDEEAGIGIAFGTVTPSEVAAKQSEADILVLCLKKGVAQTATPSKLTAYMLTGRPIVASVDTDSDCADIIRSTGCGIVVEPDDEDQLREAIVSLSEMSESALCVEFQAVRYPVV